MTAIPQPVHVNRSVLEPAYTPSILRHREEIVEELVRVAPAVSVLRVAGPAGCGKSSVARVASDALRGQDVPSVVVDARLADTEYRVLSMIVNHFTMRVEERIPFTGLNLNRVEARLGTRLAALGRVVVWFDHADTLQPSALRGIVGRLDQYVQGGALSLVIVSRSTNDDVHPDARVVNVPAYTEAELVDLLTERLNLVMPANRIVARDILKHTGQDAGKAFRVLRDAVHRAAHRGGPPSCQEVEAAYRALRISETITAAESLNPASSLVLRTITVLADGAMWDTGQAYKAYVFQCERHTQEPVTARRFTTILSDLDALGLITARPTSRGRYGQTKLITMSEDTRQTLIQWQRRA